MNKQFKQPLSRARDSFIIVNDKGLHTRPSTELVKCCVRYKSQINLNYQKNTVDAKSLLGILALAATKGTKIHVEASGPDAEEAVNAIVSLAKNKFNVDY